MTNRINNYDDLTELENLLTGDNSLYGDGSGGVEVDLPLVCLRLIDHIRKLERHNNLFYGVDIEDEAE